ncbi:MAG: 6-pyruvoyl-tetrahydropterin synthase-related protein [Anaerolineae bacterium]
MSKVASVLVFAGLVFIALVSASPLQEPFLPHGTDTLTHLYTSVQLDHLLRQGVVYSRWLPARASGFGTPLFNYYAPLSYYAVSAFCLAGADVVMAMRLALGLSLVGAAVGMYLWGRDAFDSPSGLVAAAAYVCGPYVLFNAFFRGGLNESYALLLMPWCLWSLRRLTTRRQATARMRYLILVALTYAGAILAHNLTALLFSPVLLGYAILLIFVLSPQGATGPTQLSPAARLLVSKVLPLIALALGLGLSAFFWLPMLLERNAIRPEDLFQGAEFDYRHNFINLDDLFLPPLGVTPRPALPIATIALALASLLWSRHRSPGRRAEVILFALVVVGCVLMALPLSAGLWDQLRPVLQFLQFPHRFLSLASLGLAFLAGGGLCVLRRGLTRGQSVHSHRKVAQLVDLVLLIVAVGMLLLPARVLRSVRYYPSLPEIDVGFVMQKERETGNIGTTYVVSFLPRTVQEIPPFEMLARDGSERLDRESLPSGTVVVSSDYNPLRYTLVVSSTSPFTAAFNTFHFPGWTAQLDGGPISLVPDMPYGRITTLLPAGQHRLEVWFGPTPLRLLADGISVSCLLALGFGCTIHRGLFKIDTHNTKREAECPI